MTLLNFEVTMKSAIFVILWKAPQFPGILISIEWQCQGLNFKYATAPSWPALLYNLHEGQMQLSPLMCILHSDFLSQEEIH